MKNTILALFVTLSFSVHAQEPTKDQIKQVEEARKEVKGMKGNAFPDFELISLDGTSISSKDIEGKIVLFNFWFTSCRPCIQEMPELNKLVEEFKDSGIVFIAPTFNDSEQVQKFLKRFDFSYDIIPDVKNFCLELNIRNYPTHFVINKEGIIEKVFIGYSMTTVESLTKSLKRLLRKG